MKIINQTKKIILAENFIEATSLKDQTLGLLAHSTPIAMILKSRFGIHTLLMKYPIDVLILDRENTVVAIKQHMTPNKFFLWNPMYNFIVELPQNSIKNSQTSLGDYIIFGENLNLPT